MAGKRTESDADRKNGQEVMINITIVKFPVIAGYGTKGYIWGCYQIRQHAGINGEWAVGSERGKYEI